MKSWLVGLAAMTWTGSAMAQSKPETWLTRLGRDTVAFERFTRTKDKLEGDLVSTTPKTRTTHYVVSFNADGTVRRIEFSAKSPVEGAGSPPPAEGFAEFDANGILAVITRAGKTDTTRVAASAGAVPWTLNSWGLLQLTLDRARESGGSATVDQYPLGGTRVNKSAVSEAGDSVAVSFFGSPLMVKVDRKGQLVGVDGGRTTVKIKAEPVGLDLAKLTEAFAARDRAGHSTGQLSTRDTVRATVAGAELWIDYGRPAKRGRRIIGGLVPYDTVWRTGANAATQFRTSVALEIGKTTIPAGTYTLWTIPTTRGVKLIFNKQTGQWGTEYHPEQDFARVEMDDEKLDDLVERFTISVAPEPSGGAIRFDWDHTRWAVRFKPKA